jgi:hypothetical protein
MSVELE